MATINTVPKIKSTLFKLVNIAIGNHVIGGEREGIYANRIAIVTDSTATFIDDGTVVPRSKDIEVYIVASLDLHYSLKHE